MGGSSASISVFNLKTADFILIEKVVVEPTHLKYMLVKLDHFPRDGGENIKYSKPPPRMYIYIYNYIHFFPYLSGEACSNPRWWLKNSKPRFARDMKNPKLCASPGFSTPSLATSNVSPFTCLRWGGKGRWIYHFCPPKPTCLRDFL